MTDLAKVGFSADTGPLKDLNITLDQTTQSTKSLNDELAKTNNASQSASSGLDKVASSASNVKNANLDTTIKNTGQSVDALAKSLVGAASASQTVLNVSQALDTIVAKTGVSYTAANTALIAAIAGQKAAGAAATDHSAALNKVAAAAGGAIPPINGIGQAASASMSPLGGLGGLALAGAAGIAGLAVAYGVAALSIIKAGDEVERSQSKFAALTGSVAAGSASFDIVKRSANETGVEFTSLSAAVIKASQGVDLMNRNLITVSSNQVATNVKNLTDMFTTLDKVMQSAGATAKEESQVLNDLGSGFAKSGGLTVDTFQKIRDSSIELARVIASSFGYTDLTKFQQQLALTPIPLKDLEDAIKRIKPAVDAAFDPGKPKTFEQATRDISIAWENLLQTLAKVGALDAVKTGLADISQIIQKTGDNISQLSNPLDTFAKKLEQSGAATKDWGDFVKVVADQNSIFGQSIELDIEGALTKALVTIGEFPTIAIKAITDFTGPSIQSAVAWGGSFASAIGGGLATALGGIGDFVVNAIQKLTDWANQAIALAKSVASAIAGAASGGGIPQTDGGASMVGSGAPAASSGGGASSASPADSSGSVPLGNADGLPQFAGGGSFVVGGSGGTDSQMIQFMATPGEKITIDTPGGSSSGAGGGAPTLGSLIPANDNPIAGGGTSSSSDLMSAHFADTIKTQTAAINDQAASVKDQIIAAVNTSATTIAAAVKGTGVATAATSAATSATAPATTTAASSAAAASTAATTPAATAGAGGFTTQKPKAQPTTPQEQPIAAKDFYGNPNYGGNGIGQSTVNTGRNTSKTFPSPVQSSPNTQQNPLTPLDQKTPDQIARPVDQNTSGNPTPRQSLYDPPLPAPLGQGGIGSDAGRAPLGTPFGQGGIGSDAAKGPEAVKQQTETLKQSDTQNSKSVADAVKDQTKDTQSVGDKTNQSLQGVQSAAKETSQATDGVEKASQKTSDGVDSGNQQAKSIGDQQQTALDGTKTATDQVGDATKTAGTETKDAVSQGADKAVNAEGQSANTIGNAVSTTGNSIVSAINSAASTIAQAVAAATSNNSNNQNNNNNSSSGGDSSSGGSSSGGSSSGPNTSDTSGSGGTSGGNSPAATDTGGTGFAIGGQFKIGGSGTTDTEHVEFMATPGETITITPPGTNPPPNPSMSGPSKRSGLMAFATGGQITVGQLDNTPTLPQEAADLVSAHLASDLKDQTSSLKDTLTSIASQIVAAINTGAISISNAVTSALAKIDAEAKAAAAAQQAATANAAKSSVAATAGGTGASASSTKAATDLYDYYLYHAGPLATPLGGIGGGGGFTVSGGMAEGGTFIVPGGQSNTDSIDIAVKAAPGERVIVLPPADAEKLRKSASSAGAHIVPQPLSSFLPKLQDSIPGGSAPAISQSAVAAGMAGTSAVPIPANTNSHPGANDRNVNIFLQERQQVDQFIRSRAEIQRAMRG